MQYDCILYIANILCFENALHIDNLETVRGDGNISNSSFSGHDHHASCGKHDNGRKHDDDGEYDHNENIRNDQKDDQKDDEKDDRKNDDKDDYG